MSEHAKRFEQILRLNGQIELLIESEYAIIRATKNQQCYLEIMASNKIAVEFVRYVLKQNPNADDFVAVYDAMSRTACARSFHNLGHEELAIAGISFSLLDTNRLESLISEARNSLPAQ